MSITIPIDNINVKGLDIEAIIKNNPISSLVYFIDILTDVQIEKISKIYPAQVLQFAQHRLSNTQISELCEEIFNKKVNKKRIYKLYADFLKYLEKNLSENVELIDPARQQLAIKNLDNLLAFAIRRVSQNTIDHLAKSENNFKLLLKEAPDRLNPQDLRRLAATRPEDALSYAAHLLDPNLFTVLARGYPITAVTKARSYVTLEHAKTWAGMEKSPNNLEAALLFDPNLPSKKQFDLILNVVPMDRIIKAAHHRVLAKTINNAINNHVEDLHKEISDIKERNKLAQSALNSERYYRTETVPNSIQTMFGDTRNSLKRILIAALTCCPQKLNARSIKVAVKFETSFMLSKNANLISAAQVKSLFPSHPLNAILSGKIPVTDERIIYCAIRETTQVIERAPHLLSPRIMKMLKEKRSLLVAKFWPEQLEDEDVKKLMTGDNSAEAIRYLAPYIDDVSHTYMTIALPKDARLYWSKTVTPGLSAWIERLLAVSAHEHSTGQTNFPSPFIPNQADQSNILQNTVLQTSAVTADFKPFKLRHELHDLALEVLAPGRRICIWPQADLTAPFPYPIDGQKNPINMATYQDGACHEVDMVDTKDPGLEWLPFIIDYHDIQSQLPAGLTILSYEIERYGPLEPRSGKETAEAALVLLIGENMFSVKQRAIFRYRANAAGQRSAKMWFADDKLPSFLQPPSTLISVTRQPWNAFPYFSYNAWRSLIDALGMKPIIAMRNDGTVPEFFFVKDTVPDTSQSSTTMSDLAVQDQTASGMKTISNLLRTKPSSDQTD